MEENKKPEEITAKAAEPTTGAAETAARSAEPVAASAETVKKKKEKKPAPKTPKRPAGQKMSAKNRKRLIIAVVSVVLVLAILIGAIVITAVLKNRPPELETVRDRFAEVILASSSVNEMFWGEGLPTYPRVYEDVVTFQVEIPYQDQGEKTIYGNYRYTNETDGTVVIAYRYWIAISEESGITYYDFVAGEPLPAKPDKDKEHYYVQRFSEKKGDDYIYEKDGRYYYALENFDRSKLFLYTAEDEEHYDYVRADSGYLATEDIKKTAAKVYSADYLRSIYETMFTGVSTGSAILFARYTDYENVETGQVSLMKHNQYKPLKLTDWTYDFSTMRMVEESNASFVTVEILRTDAADAAKQETARFHFALENGQWFLDSPSY